MGADHAEMFSVGDCGMPDNIASFSNGDRTGVYTTVGVVWTFTCDSGYSLSGSVSVTCGLNRLWRGSAPECSKYFICFWYGIDHYNS